MRVNLVPIKKPSYNRAMSKIHFFCASFFSFLILLDAAVSQKPDCVEREKALALFQTAEDFLSKAEDSYPSCNHDSNSTDPSGCAGKKSLAYIQISKKIISDLRGNLPECKDTTVIVKDVKYRDCSEVLASGRNVNGVYSIWPSKLNTTDSRPLKVYCDMETDDGGWTVIQRRGKFPVQQDFSQDWESYKKGFGNITEEFWLGNENIRVLCLQECEIRFDLKDKNGVEGYAVYKNFKLSDPDYTLHISDYIGDLGDGMKYHNNKTFSTKDKGNTGFAKSRHGGWWYSSNDYCQLNGLYRPGEDSNQYVYWLSWRQTKNLAGVEIKVRPK